jgi:DNA-binding transcriptional LysR family regulator
MQRGGNGEAAGERLLRNVGPRLEEIEAEIAALSELREKPSGTIRITATEYATNAVLLDQVDRWVRLSTSR